MTLVEFLAHLRDMDVRLWVEDDRLRCQAPEGVLTPDLRAELAERKNEIMAFLRGAEQIVFSTSPAIPTVPRDQPLPLSFAQQRLWFLDQLEPGNFFYNIPAIVQLAGRLHTAALQQALDAVVDRHEILRTRFVVNGEQPNEIIAASWQVALPVIDLQEFSTSDRQVQAARLIAQEIQRPFDLAWGPLLRAILLRLSEEDHVLLLTLHHIVSDGWSMGVLIRELATLYRAFLTGGSSPLSKLPIQYADYAAWQRQWLQGEVLEKQLAYWRQQLTGIPALLELPTDRPRPAIQAFRGSRWSFELSKQLSDALKAFAQNEQVTLFMLLLAAFKILLYRYTRQAEIVVGTPIANRQWRETEGLIGFFVNTLVLRSWVSPQQSFRDLLAQVREMTFAAYAHQDLPFEKLVEDLQPIRDLSRTPLFQVMFVLQNAPLPTLELPGLALQPLEVDSDVAKFDLTLSFLESPMGLRGTLEYNTDLFERERIVRLAGHLQILLESIVANPDQHVSDLPLLTEEERQCLLHEWNRPPVMPAPVPHDCLHTRFEARAAQTPDAVAVVWEDEEAGNTPLGLTYGELNRRAQHLADYLRQRGAGPEALVGLCLERSAEMLIGLLGILKAGSAYVPLDPAYPLDRLAFMLHDTRAPLVVTQAHLRERLPEHQAQIVCLDADWTAISQCERESREVLIDPDHPAYVIYTSGSTGRPKGVIVTHANVLRLFETTQAWYQFTADDVWSLFHSLAFDFSVWEVWGAWLYGGRILGVPYTVSRSPDEFYHLLLRQHVTVLNQIPSAFRQLLRVEEARETQAALALRYVIFGGEALDLASLRPWLMRHGAQQPQLINMYGITETTVHVTYRRITATDILEARGSMIGQCLPDLGLRVLESNSLLPAPIGARGELYVGGAGLARGYLARPELTAERFVPDPWAEQAGARLYKTGDAARYLPNGDLEYLGRLDQQVKVRGFRIELGEIEAALNQHPAIRESLVVVRDEAEGQRRLVAYVIPRAATMPGLTDVHAFLKRTLPDYMLPAALVPLTAWPRTPSGKIDPRALPQPDQSRPEIGRVYVAPRTPIEEVLAGIWIDVLNIKQVGIHDNFFELGGHSLLATQVISRVRQAFQVELPLRSLFEEPTVADLATRVTALHQMEQRAAILPLVAIKREPPYVLSFAQERLWFLDQFAPDSTAYTIPWAIRVTGSLNVAVLERSLADIVRRHEILRTTFRVKDEQPIQVISSSLAIPVPLIDLQELVESEREGQVLELAIREAARPFDLAQGPLLRVSLLRLSEQEHVLLLTMHHIASDGWSMGIFIQEVAALYRAFCVGQFSPLPELPIQYVDYAAWQRAWLQGQVLEKQLTYWKQQLSGKPPVLQLPTDRPHLPIQTFRGARQLFTLEPALLESLRQFSRRENATLFMVLLAAFETLLYRYTGQTDLWVGVPIANRTRSELEALIGFFVNTLVLRSDLSGNPTFLKLVEQIRKITVEAYEHQDLPFEMLVKELQPERDLSRTPLFQVMFAFQTTALATLNLPGLQLNPIEVDIPTAKFDLTLTMIETEQSLQGQIVYNTDLFDSSTIVRWLNHFQALLKDIALHPDRRIDHASLLLPSERLQQLTEWQGARGAYPHVTLAAWLAAQVARTPERVALVCGEEHLTYQALNQRAHQLAQHLQHRGVGPNVRVGLCLERSIELVVSLWGILQAGGAYVPLDPTYPPERLTTMLADAQVAILVTQAHLTLHLPAWPGSILCLDSAGETLAQESAAEPISLATPQDLLYVIFTSGSTGRPKGAGVYQHSFVNLLQWFTRDFNLTEDDRTLILSSFSFDLTQKNFFAPLLVGGQLRLLPSAHYDPTQIREAVAEGQVTWLNCTPSAFYPLVENAEPQAFAALTSLRYVFLGGEPIALPRLEPWRSAPAGQAEVVNTYGPTECTDICLGYRLPRAEHRLDATVPLGRPIDNTRVLLLNPAGELMPVGVVGEVCVAGVGVGLGYLNDPALTASKFVPDPFSTTPGARLYRTGDLARARPDGIFEFLGRADQQVKVRGFRIELSEIETALRQHPLVQEVVVVARDVARREERTGGEEVRLVAYLVSPTGQTLALPELHDFLRDKVPDYMFPAACVWLAALPLTPNGKLDRRALPAPEANRPDLRVTYRAPRSPVEAWLAQLWARVLHLERVGVHDNFFELGGDSIQGALLINQVQEQLGEVVYVVALFDAPTVAELASYLQQHYPQALARRLALTGESTSAVQHSTLTAEDVTLLRQLIPPLAPRRVPPTTKNRSAIFVLSPPRSGSTLLRVMLAGHPHLFAPPELELLSFNTLGERQLALSGRNRFWREGTLRAWMQLRNCTAEDAERFLHDLEDRDLPTQDFYRLLQAELGSRVLVDKSPSYALDLNILQRAEEDFHEARYIHLLRHPAAALWSFEEAHLEQVFFRYAHPFTPRQLGEAIWLISQQNILTFLAQVPPQRQMQLRFEDLLRDPQPSLERLCAFLEIDFQPAMLHPYQDPAQRMTDGVQAASRMLGDVRFHEHSSIDPRVADRWQAHLPANFLSDLTWHTAHTLRYPRISPDSMTLNGSAIASSLMKLQTGQVNKRPLFLVHPAGGNLFCYAHLVRQLGADWPIYGLQAPGLIGEQEPYTQVEALAHYYVNLIRTIQPVGPYLLGGWSFGGIVAFEMAQQFQAEGQSVALLALLDSHMAKDDQGPEIDEATLLAALAQELGLTLGTSPDNADRAEQLDLDKQLAHLVEQARRAEVVSSDIDLDQVRRLFNVFKNNLHAARRYVPHPYTGPVVLFKASEQRSGTEEDLGWGALVGKNLTRLVIPGNHETILHEPNIPVLAKKIRNQLLATTLPS